MGKICLCLFLALGTVWAQQSSYHADVDLLQVPVTVLNRRGLPVPGLNKADFSVKIDGHAVPVTALDEVKPAALPASALPAMPPQTYSNVAAQVPAQRIILLIDSAHIPLDDLMELNRELHNWLARPWPAGVQIAVFSFDRNMTLLQPFTPDTSEVQATLQQMVGYHAGRGQLEGISRELIHLEGTGAEVKSDLFHGPQLAENELSGSQPVRGEDAMAAVVRLEARLLRIMQQMVVRNQAIDMLDTWEAFARLFAGIPGRKNVIWLTSQTTLLAANDHELEISQHRLHSVFAELDQANVALFPVDVTTLKSYASNEAEARLGRPGPLPEDAQTAIRARGLEDRQMDWAAQETGGEAFGPSNQIGVSLNKVLRATSESYVLSVTPPRNAAAGTIHRIEVSVHGRGLKTLYRRSWLPPNPEAVADSRKQFLADATVLAYNPLSLGGLTLVAKTGDWARGPSNSAAGSEMLPFVLTTKLTPLLHHNQQGQPIYDFSFLRILLPLDGSADPLLLPPRHFHATLPAGPVGQREYAVRVRSDSGVIAAGHPYLLRLIVRDNISGRGGSLTLRLNAPLPARHVASAE